MIALVSEPAELATAGFAVVIQDCRGRFGSEGEWGYIECEVPRRLRHGRVGGGGAVVKRPGGHVRGVVYGLHPVAGGRAGPRIWR